MVVFAGTNFHCYLGIGLILISISLFYGYSVRVKEFTEVCDVCHVNHEVQSYNMNVSNFQECKRNCLSIVKSLEDYGEKNNYYPSSLKELKPKYIKSVPTCPNHYWQYEYSTNSGKTMYTLSCGVNSHTDAGFPKDYPLFTGKIKKKNTESKK